MAHSTVVSHRVARALLAVAVVSGALSWAAGQGAAQTAPSINLKPDCTDQLKPPWRITVSGTMTVPNSPVEVIFDYGGAAPTFIDKVDQSGHYQFDFVVQRAGPQPAAGYLVHASQPRQPKLFAETRFRVPCPPPPTTSPPTSGSTTSSSTTSTTTPPPAARPELTISVVVFGHTAFGARTLLAASGATAATAPFLVVPGSQQPSGFFTRR